MRLSFSCAFHFPILPKSVTYGCLLSKPCQTKAWGQGEQSASVCLIATLKCQTWAYYSWVSIYILHSTLCTLCFKASASGSLIPTTSSLLFPLSARLSICNSFTCVESLLEFAGQGGALKEMDFSQHWMKFGNWNMPSTILMYPPNWKAREELNAGEGSAVCFADLGQLSYWKCFLCVEFKMADVYSRLDCAGEAESTCNWSNLQQ